MLKYMCDFETSTEAWLEFDDEARVWASCICTIEAEPKIIAMTNNLDDFMNALVKCGNCEAYFHNLKFDGEYIISWLFKNGYTYNENARKPHTFSVVISDTGQWY